MRFIIRFHCLLLCILNLTCCEESTIEPTINEDADYYPIDIGLWHEYSIRHIIIDVRTGYYDTTNYNIKETVSKIISDNKDETVFLVERNIKSHGEQFWQPFDAIQIIKRKSTVIRSIDNIDEFILPAQITKGESWDGNSYNTLDSTEYKIAQTDTTYLLNETVMDSVIRIQHKQFTSLINIENEYELYAPNIGLVYSESISAESQTISIDNSGEAIPVIDRVEVGEFIYKSLVAYGDYNSSN